MNQMIVEITQFKQGGHVAHKKIHRAMQALEIKKRINDLTNEGNKYLLYFSFIFLFVFLAIVVPLKHPGDISINEAITSINSRLSLLKDRSNQLIKQQDTAISTREQEQTAMRILETQEKITDLIKEKVFFVQIVDKSVNLPIVNVAINQSTVVGTFMGFILIGLSFALHKRNQFFELYCSLEERERRNVPIPFWCAPIPLTTHTSSLKDWVFKNSLGLFVHLMVIYLGYDSITAASKVDAETNALNIIIYAAAIAIYLMTVLRLIKQEWIRATK